MALDPKRVADIAQQMYGAVTGANQELSDKNDAKLAATQAGEALLSKRELILGAVAELSAQGAWTGTEIKAAAKAAAQMHNDTTTKSAVATFVNDCQRAANPAVRDRFEELVSVVQTAWADETEQHALDGDVPTPIKKLFKRRYHAILGVFKVVADGVNPINDVDDLIEYAKANDPDFDADKVAKRLAKMVADLAEFAVDFPMDALSHAVRTLGEIEPNDLSQARANKIAGRAQHVISSGTTTVASPNANAAHPFTPKAKITAKPAPTKVTTPAQAEVTAGAIDDLMGDNSEGIEVDLAEAAD